jgi:hypothetical protein
MDGSEYSNAERRVRRQVGMAVLREAVCEGFRDGRMRG